MKKLNILLLLSILSAIQATAQWSSSGANIYNSNGGNVGIGTGSNPLFKLHVMGGSAQLEALNVIQNAYFGLNVGIGAQPQGAYKLLVLGGNTKVDGLEVAQTFTAFQSAIFNANVSFNQNVGIGTQPQGIYKLLVQGGNTKVDGLEVAQTFKASQTAIFIGTATFGIATFSNVGIGTAPTSEKLEVAGNIKADGIKIGTGPLITNLTPSQWVTNGNNISYTTGKVGIGTSTPNAAALLDVNGLIKTTGLLLPTGAAINKVLTSDATGNASWATLPASSQWVTGGSDISYSTGKVGIGTATPDASSKLDVNGTIKANGILFPAGAGADKFLTSDASGNASWHVPQWITNGNDISYATGKVGIGTYTPTELLAVDGYNPYLKLWDKTENINSVASGIKFYAGPLASYGLANESARIEVKGNFGRADLFFYTGYYSGEGTIAPKMVLTADGRVGIGTLNPTSTLDVNGHIQTIAFSMPTGATDGYFLRSDGSGYASWAPAATNSLWETDGTNTYYNSGGLVGIGLSSGFHANLDIYDGASSASPRMYVRGDNGAAIMGVAGINTAHNVYGSVIGDVIIGSNKEWVANPENLKNLIINSASATGSIKFGVRNDVTIPAMEIKSNGVVAIKNRIDAPEFRACLNAGSGDCPPDYVFDSDYKLMGLDTLKAYLAKNKHLPEVPSAKEMLSNGLDMKAMNMTLLKKVEELTLYILKQEERISKLEKDK